MVSDADVLGLSMKGQIGCKGNCTLVINKDFSCVGGQEGNVLKKLLDLEGFLSSVIAMYSPSVLDSAIDGCFFELQLMAAPAIIKVNPETEQ